VNDPNLGGVIEHQFDGQEDQGDGGRGDRRWLPCNPVMPCRALSWCGAVVDCPVVVRRVPRPLCVLDHQRAPLRNSSTTLAGSFFACILQIHCARAYDSGSWRKKVYYVSLSATYWPPSRPCLCGTRAMQPRGRRMQTFSRRTT
jgi:hypothetical protein